MNQLNKSVQGPGENVLSSIDKIFGFKRKLNLWKNHVAKRNLWNVSIAALAQEGGRISVSLKSYWKPPGRTAEQNWTVFPLPFNRSVWQGEGPFPCIFCSAWELDVKTRGRTFWAAVWSYTQDEVYWPVPGQVLYFCEGRVPAIHRKAMNIFLTFSTSYMCEQAFSCLTSMKRKDRNCLISVEDEIPVCLSQKSIDSYTGLQNKTF
jgi:hypothetical protein